MTPGKTAFVDGLEKKYPQLVSDQLEKMTVDEIVTFLTEEDLDYSDDEDDPEDDLEFGDDAPDEEDSEPEEDDLEEDDG